MARSIAPLVLVGACYSMPGPPAAADGELYLVQQYCEKAFACEAAWDMNRHMQNFGDAFTASSANCVMKWGLAQPQLVTLGDATAAGRVLYDDEATQRCLDRDYTSTCADFFDFSGPALGPVCPGAFMGTVPVGSACQLTLECVTGTCMGTCVQ